MIDRRLATTAAARRRNALVQWHRLPDKRRERSMEQQLKVEEPLNVTPRQFFKDFAFTCLAAFGTGAAVGAASFIIVRLLV
jgi:hypothetical protein